MKYNIFLDLGMYISECDVLEHIHTHKLFSHGVDRLTFKVTRMKKKILAPRLLRNWLFSTWSPLLIFIQPSSQPIKLNVKM